MIQEGFPITKPMKNILHKILDTQDLMEVAQRSGVSYSTVRNIYYRTQTITLNNKIVVYKLLNAAFAKSCNELNYFTEIINQLNLMMPKVNDNRGQNNNRCN